MNLTKMLAQLVTHEHEWVLYFEDGEYCLASDKVHATPVVVAHSELEKVVRLLWLHYYGSEFYHINFDDFTIIDDEQTTD